MDADTTKFLENAGMFRCIPLRATLSVATCAKNYRFAATFACRNCQVGQQHAQALSLNHAKPEDASRWDSCIARECVRCGRRVLRLVRDGTLCPSCYNRQQEVVRGRNAKGATPQKWAFLRPAFLTIEQDGNTQLVALGLCSGRPEAGRVAARWWPGSLVTGFWMDSEPLATALSRKSPDRDAVDIVHF
ncbi:hypothetical protein B2G74_22250 [Burkholderia sp. A27]|nr:hypothetical protein B2G74_22250 [Burkholderia sp. A27]